MKNYARCSRQFLGRWWCFHLYFLVFGNAVSVVEKLREMLQTVSWQMVVLPPIFSCVRKCFFVVKKLREMLETISWEMVVLPPIFSCLRKSRCWSWKSTRDAWDNFLGMVVLPPIFSYLRKCCFCSWKTTRDARDSFLGDGGASSYIFLSSEMLFKKLKN